MAPRLLNPHSFVEFLGAAGRVIRTAPPVESCFVSNWATSSSKRPSNIAVYRYSGNTGTGPCLWDGLHCIV